MYYCVLLLCPYAALPCAVPSCRVFVLVTSCGLLGPVRFRLLCFSVGLHPIQAATQPERQLKEKIGPPMMTGRKFKHDRSKEILIPWCAKCRCTCSNLFGKGGTLNPDIDEPSLIHLKRPAPEAFLLRLAQLLLSLLPLLLGFLTAL